MEEKMVVRLVQLADVVVGEGGKIGVRFGPLAQPPAKDIGRCLQKDDEIRRGHVRREQLVQTLIDEQLVVVEIQIRMNLVAVEQVVADRQLAEQIGLPERRLLPMTRQREEELRLKSCAAAPGMKIGNEGIIGFVEDDVRVEAGAKAVGEERFANARRSFDRDVPEIQS